MVTLIVMMYIILLVVCILVAIVWKCQAEDNKNFIDSMIILEDAIRAINTRLKEIETETNIIYCGTEDRVEFFKEIITALGLDIKYQVKIVDGEYEIEC